MGNIISISQAGIDELEIALDQPEQATTHFPPAQGIVWKPVTAPPTITQDAIEKPAISEEWIGEESIQPLPYQPLLPHPLPSHIAQNDSAELAPTELAATEPKSLGEVNGLDPREISGELAPHHRGPLPEPVHKQNPEPIVEPVTTGYPEHEPDETELDVILEALSQQLPNLALAPDGLAQARAEIDTARVQLASPKPKPHILAAALQILVSILEAGCRSSTSEIREGLRARAQYAAAVEQAGVRHFQEHLSM
jgi:hypothetical protein